MRLATYGGRRQILRDGNCSENQEEKIRGKIVKDDGAGTSAHYPLLLLNRAANLRKHRVGIGTNQPHRTDHDYQDHRQHNCVFGDILALLFGPELM